MQNHWLHGIAMICLALLAACGEAPPAAKTHSSAPAAEAPTAPAPQAAARDLALLQVCTRVPVADVAAAAGGRALNEANFGGFACNYVVATDVDTEMYGIAVSAPSEMQALLDYIGPGEKGETVDELGGQAWLGTGAGADMSGETSQPTLRILREDHAIEVRGPRKEVVAAIGRLAAERIQ